MAIYFSTFISGLQEVVESAFKKEISDIDIKSLEDGLVIYSTLVPVETITKLRFINNTFSLIKSFKNVNGDTKSINSIIKRTLEDKNVFYHINKKTPDKNLTFRIVISKENTTISPDKNVINRLINKISENSKFRLEPLTPNTEFWYFIRREGDSYFGIRLTNSSTSINNLQKGELRKELSNLLCYVSEPTEDDVFLDPFAGSGSIPIERFNSFPYKKIIAGDSDENTIYKLKQRLKLIGKEIHIEKLDARNMVNIFSNSINKIVTDPPWGVTLEKDLDLNKFYTEILSEFYRVLTKDGIVILLLGRVNPLKTILIGFSGKFQLLATYDILVSGQKSTIYKLRKI